VSPARESAVRVGLVYPELLGTYGDRGNAVVLVQRLRRRGIDAELVEVTAGSVIPESLDVFLFGGGEDNPQEAASAGMRASSANIDRARAAGAVVFAVCAGFQLLGTSYETGDGEHIDGLGLVDAVTAAVPGAPRLIGEVVVEPEAPLPTLTGFENHAGRTRLGPTARPLGRVRVGGGNGDGVDGALGDRVVGTYLHGPVLPRNPALADFLLERVVGPLPALASPLEERLREQRLDVATAGPVGRWRERLHVARG
jgi:CobQ-like glutamine amidotransferase family enzyme